MAEIYKIPLEKDEFLEAIKSNWNSFKNDKKNTTKAIAQYAVDNSLIKQDFNTVSTLAKDKLRSLILEAQDPQGQTATVKKISNGSESLATDIVNVLDELKLELQNRPLNKFIKNRAIKAIESLMNKIEDDKKLENLGMIGNGVVITFTFLDVLIDLKSIPKKIKEYREKRAKQEALKKENANKQK